MSAVRLPLIGRLQSYSGHRVKCVALYLTVINENGEEVSLDGKAVWNIFPYRAAADDLDRLRRPDA